MYQLIRYPDEYRIEYGSGEQTGANLRFERGEGLKIFLSAQDCAVKFVRLRWRERTEGSVRILGDDWERLYGTAEWRGIVSERTLPWYMLIAGEDGVQGVGVKVRPSALCYWRLDRGGITLTLDVRCASEGVCLNGREIMAAEVVSQYYEKTAPFEAAKRFCRLMSDSPVLPIEPVYGSNNWYYAYGNSSHQEILKDSEFVASLTKGLVNRPYMVVDDGWSPNRVCGPWHTGNERFPDMARLAREMKEIGVKPGIWFRPLFDESPFSASAHTLANDKNTLDPTDPAVLQYVAETVSRIKSWGFGLIKHDFSSFDISGKWAFEVRSALMTEERRFQDNTRTTAEVAKTLYKTIYDNADGMMIIGCNCLNHLCSGYAHINRVGDDTSGQDWERTRKMGINALAFRLCQDGSFFKTDADCVGLTAQVPWEKNRQWLDLLSRSGTPLFVSAKISDVTESMKDDLRRAFALASVQQADCEPLDWMENTCPSRWRFGSETVNYDWDADFGAWQDI